MTITLPGDLDHTALLGAAAAVISAASFLLYLRSILLGRSRPSRMTWGIFAGLSVLSTASYATLGATDTLLPAIIFAVESCTIFAVSFRYGVGGWDPLDRVTLAGVVVVGLAWAVTGNALVALLLALVVDSLALAPTIAKTWADPSSEEPMPWAATALGNGFMVAALDLTQIGDWTIELAAYPLYVFAVDTLVLALSLRRPCPVRVRQGG